MSTLNHTVKRISTNKNEPRYEEFEGKKHLVVPSVILKEGVHNKLLYTAEELAKFPEAWNGIPVPVLHPEANGTPISCNDPKVIESRSVGRIFNTRYEADKLIAEIWIDVAKAERIDANMLNDLKSGKMIEISTGLWTDDDGVEGTWNGEEYVATVMNFRPDHLALLPGSIGACSIADGCGAPRWNKEESMAKMPSILVRILGKSAQMAPDFHLQDNAKLGKMSFSEVARKLNDRVSSAVPGDVFVADVFDKEFVYLVSKQNTDGTWDDQLYRRSYSVSGNEVTIGEEAEPVEEKRTYVAANKDKGDGTTVTFNVINKTTNNNSKEEELNMDREEKIKALIEAGHFTDEDKENLTAMSCETFAKVEALANKEPEKAEKEVEKKEEEKPVVENKEEEVKEKTFNELLEEADPETRQIMKAMRSDWEKKKATLIDNIKKNKANKFSDEKLKGMEMEDLEALAELAKTVNYGAKGGNYTPPTGNEEKKTVPPVPNIFAANEKTE